MSDSDLFNGVRGPAQGDKVSRRRLLELGAVGAAAVAGTGLLSGSGRAFAAALEAGSLPYKANTSAKGSITFWHFWGSKVRRGAINSIIADFQKIYPGVTVNALYVPFGDIWTKNIAAVAAGTGMPDVIIEDRVQLRTRAKQHIDENLASMVKRDGINMGLFWPFTVVESVYNGDPYGLPYETDIRVLYYNKDQFKAAGLDPNRPPQNWNDLASYANKLDAKSGNSGGNLQRVAFYPVFFGGLDIWAWNNGGEWVDSHNNPTLNAPANVATLTWMKGWADRYGGKSKLDAMQSTFGSQGPTDGFMSGKVSMVVDIQGYQRFLNIYKPFNAGVASITPAPGHKPASTSGGFAVAMPTSRGRDAATRAAAWEFMKYLSLVGQASWAANTYGMPTVESIAKTNSTLTASPHWTEFVSAMSYGRAGVYNPYYPTMMGDLVTPAQDAGLSGKYSPKQALTVAQNQAINEINRNRR